MIEMIPSWDQYPPRNLQGGIGSLLKLWDGSHFDHHVWRWVIVPTDLSWSFSAICTPYRWCVFYSEITYMCEWFKSMRERQHTLNKIAPYVMARWPLQQIPPLHFLDTHLLPLLSPSCVWNQSLLDALPTWLNLHSKTPTCIPSVTTLHWDYMVTITVMI